MSLDTTTLARDLGAYVQASDTTYLTACASEAVELVTAHCGARLEKVPGPILRRAVLEAAAALYHHRTALAGVSGFEDTDITPPPVPAPRNPMAGAYPLLRPWLGVGIA